MAAAASGALRISHALDNIRTLIARVGLLGVLGVDEEHDFHDLSALDERQCDRMGENGGPWFLRALLGPQCWNSDVDKRTPSP
jgi:hypothetical protein